MGLDAFVRCRCFEDRKLKPGPVPYEDLYIDEDGYLGSKTLDSAYERLGFDAYTDKYQELVDKFREWKQTACEHEDLEICTEE